MSRPHKAIVDYFPHYVNHGKTMFTIESKYGNDGYSFWYKILELLGSSEHHYLDCNNSETWEFLLAKTHLNENLALSILNTCSKLNAIDQGLWQNKIIRSNNFIENLNSVYKRREINIYSNEEIMSLCQQKPHSTSVIVDINPQSKVKYSKGKEKPEKPALSKSDFIDSVVAEFQKVFTDYVIITPGKERKMASKLIEAWKKDHPEQNADDTLKSLHTYFEACKNIPDNWHRDKMSLCHIVNQFNVINSILKSGYKVNGSEQLDIHGKPRPSKQYVLLDGEWMVL